MAEYRVLILSDEKNLAKPTYKVLSSAGYNVEIICPMCGYKSEFSDAIILVSRFEEKSHLDLAKRLYMQNMNTPIIALTTELTTAYIKTAMECGVSRTLSLTDTAENINNTIIELIDREKARVSNNSKGNSVFEGNIISVFGTKGGTGKTTIAVNMAIALSIKGKKCALLDLDLQFGDVGVFLDISKSDNIATLIENNNMSKNVIQSYMHIHSSGVYVLCAPPSPEYAELISQNHIESIIKGIRDSFDYIILDMPPVFNEVSIAGLEMSKEIYFITNPDISTIRNTKISFEVFDSIKMSDKLKLVINKDGYSTINSKIVEEILEKKAQFIIKYEKKSAVNAVNRGIPVVLSDKKCKMTKGIFEYVDSIVVSVPKKRKWGRK